MKKIDRDTLIRASASGTGILFGARRGLDIFLLANPEYVDDFSNVEKALICLNIIITIPPIQHGVRYTKYVANKKYLLEKYNEYLKRIAEFLKEMDMANNPIEVYSGLMQMIFEGAISKDKKFNPKGETYDYLKRGISVITGSGVCRHLAPLLTDVLNCLGFEATNLNGYLTTEFGKKTTFTQKELKYLSVHASNHTVSIAKVDDKAVVFDPMNSEIISTKLYDNILLTEDYRCLFAYKDWKVQWELEGMKEVDIRRILLNMPLLTVEEYNRYLNASISKVYALSFCCDGFYKENEEFYKDVSEIALYPKLIHKR